MKRSYDRKFQPPAAVVPVRIRRAGGTDALTLDGKLDTGADICGLPEWVISTLDLPPLRMVRATGFSGIREQTPIYRMDLEIGNRLLPDIDALATRRPYAIIGRNVLANAIARFDGPGESLDLRWPSTKRGPRRSPRQIRR